MRNTRVGREFRSTLTLFLLILASAVVADDPVPDDPTATDGSVMEKALSVSPGYTTPVVGRDGEPVAIFYDLNGDGRLDVTILTIALDARVESNVETLADPLRLYAEGVIEPVFILETYFAGQEAIATVDLGRRTVWTGLERVELTRHDLPVAASVTFRTRTGTQTELVVFHEHGLISRFSFEESRNRHGALVDLNSDGQLDVVTALRAPESGRGYETFVEIHELGSQGFRRTGSLPLVRTVNDFLRETAVAMERGEWESVARQVRSQPGRSVPDTLDAAFAGVRDEEIDESRFEYPETGIRVLSATFPLLADNPFPAPFLGRSFRFVFRVESSDASAHFFEATIALAADPFADRPLTFLTYGESGK